MGEETAIAWTDHTFNPWWGCVKVDAPGDEPSECDNCYAATGSVRFGFSEDGGNGPALWGRDAHRRTFGDKHWNEPRKWDRLAAEAGVRDLVFCASYADVFEARDDLDPERARLWDLIESTPNLVWQLLTKRPEQVVHRVPRRWLLEPGNLICSGCGASGSIPLGRDCHDHRPRLTGWPPNVWIGTSVGTDRAARIRIPRLLEVPAPVRFLSCEPLLGPVDLSVWLGLEWMDALRVPGDPLSFRGEGGWGQEMMTAMRGDRPGIAWVIIGGESGPGYRPMDLDHARDLRDQVRAAEVPLFFKQRGGLHPKDGGDHLDGVRWQEFPDGMAGRHEIPVTL